MRRRAIGALALLLAGLLTACGPFGDDGSDEAERVARDLTEALATGDLGGVPFVVPEDGSEPAASYAEIVAGLDDGAAVDLVGVEVAEDAEGAEDAATATLAWSWTRPAGTWEYQTQAQLRRPADGPERESETGGWEVVWDPAVVQSSLTEGDRLRETRLSPARGDILGAGDRPLVEPRPVLRVGVDRSRVAEAEAAPAARQVARLVGIEETAYAELVAASGERAFVEAIVYRLGDLDAGLRSRIEAVAGATVLSDELPLAPARDFAPALLGTVGPATAEIVEESEGRVAAGDEVGRSGLQLRYDGELSGAAGVSFDAVSEASAARELFRAEATDGAPLRTTLDLDAQRTALRVLADVGPASALVAVRPSTGDLVAAASGPGSEGLDTAGFGQYAPGSTFKIVSSLALLRDGVRPESPVTCEPTATVDGRRFTNYDDYPASGLGRITLREAVASSCNTAFIAQVGRLGAGDLARAAAALGFGVDHDLGFPAYFGQVPAAESETGAAADLIGQGTVLASPMSMATVMASVVRGEAVLPRLLPENEVEQVVPEEPLTRGEAQALRGMLRGVVEQGSGSVLADLPGPPVLAKTGTAEYGDRPPLPTHAWMVAARGDLAVAVFVETGASGSSTAGPVLRDFLAAVR